MMNFAQIGILGSLQYKFSGFDVDYQAVLNKALALGYALPSPAQWTKQNQLVLNLKSHSIWSALDVLYIFATDGGSDFATLNWINPATYQCSKVNSPTFTNNQGFTGNGTTNYLDTTFAPSEGTNYQQNDASAFANDLTDFQSNTQLFGSGQTAINNLAMKLQNRSTTNNAVYCTNDSTNNSVGNTNAAGFYHLKRTAASGAGAKILYKDGSLLGSTTTASTGESTNDFAVLASRINSGVSGFRASQVGIFGAGNKLAGAESNLYTDWNNYYTSL